MTTIPRVDRGVAVVLTAAVGGILALQAPINAQLGRATGSLAAKAEVHGPGGGQCTLRVRR